jgi:hypothetical protein
MPTYNTNTNPNTWATNETQDFFAFKGEGGLSITQTFGDVSGAIRKYDMEDAVMINMKADTINSRIQLPSKEADFSHDTVSLLYTDISNADTVVYSMGSRFKKIYSDFVGEVQDYFGITDITSTTWDVSNVGLLFDLPTATSIIARTNSSREITTDGFKLLINNSNTSNTCTLKLNGLLKNFENAYKTDVFANKSSSKRLKQFCPGDLIYFVDGITVNFSVNLIDNSSNTELANGNTDYYNSTTGLGAATSVNTTGITTTSTTTIGTFSTTSSITISELSKTYKAPMVIKIIA